MKLGKVEKGSNPLLALYGWFGKTLVQNKGVFGSAANNPERKTRLHREIEATARQIDQIVYGLYGLTEKEIKIVEEAVAK